VELLQLLLSVKKAIPGHIVTLINEIKPAVAKYALPGNAVNNSVRQNVIDQVNNL
jgi:carbonic anhydrase